MPYLPLHIMKWTYLLLLFVTYPLFSQNTSSWATFSNNRSEYPVLSPLNGKMRTHFVGMQVDSRLLKNNHQGFFLLQAGFRKDASTGKTTCLEVVFRRHPDELEAMSVEVELLAFDIRQPQAPIARFKGVVHHLQLAQELKSVRCQIPVDLSLESHHAFVFRALPPFHTIPYGKYKEIGAQRLWEGPWIEDTRKEVFIYAPVAGVRDYEAPPSENPSAGSGMVFNQYGYSVPEKLAAWSKKGSNYARSYYQNGLHGMKATDGTVLIPAQYEQITYAYGGFMIATKGGKTGVVNEANAVVIPFEYKQLDLLYKNPQDPAPPGVRLEELRLVARKEDGSVGIINGRGKVIAPFRVSTGAYVQYFYPSDRHSTGAILSRAPDYAQVRQQSALIYASHPAGAVNGDGEVLLPFEYRSIHQNYTNFHPDWVEVLQGDSLGLFDLNGQWVFPPGKYHSLGYLQLISPELLGHPTLLIATTDTPPDEDGVSYRKAGLIDSLGAEVLPFEFDGFGLSFYWKNQLYCWVQKGSKWGLVNQSKETVVPFEHYQPTRRIQLGGIPHFSVQDPFTKKWGLLSITNQLTVPFEYLLIESGSDKALLVVDTLYQTTLLNSKGERILSDSYTDIQRLRYGYFRLMQKGKMGVADPAGKVLFAPTYTSVADEVFLPGMKSYFTAKGVEEKEVVTILSNENTSWALLRDGRLIEL